MNQKKAYFVLIGISIVILLFLLGYYYFGVQKNNGYIIFPGGQVFYKKGNNMTLVEKNFQSDQYANIIVVVDNQQMHLKFTISDGKVEFYNNKEKIDLEEFTIAYSPKLDIKLKNYSETEMNQEEIKQIDTILEEHGIIGYENLNVKKKVSLTENNQTNDIYIVSNLFDESKYDKVFSFAYYFSNNQIHYLIEKVDSVDNAYDLCIPSISSYINFNHSQQSKVVLSCEYFSDIGTDNKIYQLNNHIWESWN